MLFGDGMIDDPNMHQVSGPFEFWEKEKDLRDSLLEPTNI